MLSGYRVDRNPGLLFIQNVATDSRHVLFDFAGSRKNARAQVHDEVKYGPDLRV